MPRPAIVLASCVFILAVSAVGAQETGTNATRLARVMPVVSIARHQPAMAPGGQTFEYMLVPFHHTNFRTLKEFQKWLNRMGAKGWSSIAHFPAFDPKDHRRLFMRPVGGPTQRVSFSIARHRVNLANDGVEKWVPEFDRLGRRGKVPVWTFDQGGKHYVVTEARKQEGELRTLGWERTLVECLDPDGNPVACPPFNRQLSPFKRAFTKLAESAHVPITIGFPTDMSELYVVGRAETTGLDETPPDRGCVRGEDRDGEAFVKCVKLRFGRATISTPPAKWKRLVDRQAKKGYRLVQVELADNTGRKLLLIFAQVKFLKGNIPADWAAAGMRNGEVTRRTCVVEPLVAFGSDEEMERMIERLNSRGAAGYEQVIVTFAGGFDKFQFVLCRDIA